MARIYKRIDPTAPSGGGSGTTVEYSQTFSVATWSGPSGGEYSITVLASNHGCGTTPIVQVHELILSNYEQVETDVSINSSGDVTISVTENIDNRFNGRITIIGEE